MDQLPIQTIDPDRLIEEIHQLAQISDAPAPAVTRVLYTETDLAGRAFVKKLAEDAGLEVREDAIGNTFMRWQGEDANAVAVATGSHIDAIPHSGRYDGVVGVLGAIAAIRALQTARFKPRRPIEAVMFTAEEPTRFGLGCLGSRALCGQLDEGGLLALRDADGHAFDEARQAAGFHGGLDTVHLTPGCYHAFVELHIEQGPELARQGIDIGAVRAIAAPATLRATLAGDGGHAGARLMPGRRDALIPAAQIALAVQKAALKSPSPDAVATTGRFEVFPGAVNSIPSKVTMEIDVRDTQLASRDAMVAKIKSDAEQLAKEHQVDLTTELLNADPPATCHQPIVIAVDQCAKAAGLTVLPMVSRAYHDSLFMAQLCPTGMIFVPSKNGYSHRPEEYTAPSEIANGVAVLANTLARLANQ